MTNGEKFAEIFNLPCRTFGCPTIKCSDCPDNPEGRSCGDFWGDEWVGQVYNSAVSNSNDLLNWLNSKLTPDTPLDYAMAIYDVIQYIREAKNETN